MTEQIYDSTEEQQKFIKTRTARELQRLNFALRCSIFLTLILAVALVIIIGSYSRLSANYARNVKIAWVKVEPSGRTYVDYVEDSGTEARYVNDAIRASLGNYIKWRFTVDPRTIKTDYGNASTYLAPIEYQKFVVELDAPGTAISIIECALDCPITEIALGKMDTELSTPAEKQEDRIYRTTIYYNEIVRVQSTGQELEQRRKRATLKWKFKEREGLARNIDFLRVNPIGLHIIEQIIDDDILAN